MKSKAERKHDKHTERIWEFPKIIGLENIILSARETKMFVNNELYHQPDNLCFDPDTGILYNIEYKTRLRGEHRAKKQLQEQEEILKNVFSIPYKIINLFVYEDYMVEKI